MSTSLRDAASLDHKDHKLCWSRPVDNKLQTSGQFNPGDKVQVVSKSRLVGWGRDYLSSP